MDYSLKTVSQLRPMLLGFRKQAGLTQEKVAQRLGISQQSYAAFEAHPEAASVDRLFRVLRLFAVEMRLSSAASSAPVAAATAAAPVSPGKRKAASAPATRGAAAKKRAAPTAAPAAAPGAAKRTTASAAGKRTAPKTRAKPRKREDW
ncbi:helix-turn-helix domain-containing protein [Paraburkholderia tagetis]|uniref:Helix-turn-helix domain-containing protein n=1 Tax=Paraburkholderia tagetis TaxID=2913261 RepID=A0A9X1UDT2_9BURK|nr:helix-turn-helix domain-containing protein [Paraburkholderia tagetis]